MTISAFVIRILFLAIPGILASKVYKKLRGRPTREAWESFIEISIFSLLAYSLLHIFGFDHAKGSPTPLIVKATAPFSIGSVKPILFLGPPPHLVSATQTLNVNVAAGGSTDVASFEVAYPVTIASTRPISVGSVSSTTFIPNGNVTISPPTENLQTSSIFEAFLNEQLPIGSYVHTIAHACWIATILALIGSYLHNYGVVNYVGRCLRASKRSGDEDAWTFFANSDEVQWVFVRDFSNNRVYYGSIKRFSDSEKPKELVLNDVLVYESDSDKLLYCVDAMFISRDHEDWTIEVPSATPNGLEATSNSDIISGE